MPGAMPVPRALPLLACLALLTAGCLAEEKATPAALPTVPTPFEAEGVAWLPNGGSGRGETLIPFPVDATGMALTATLHLGASYGVDLPASTADVVVELRAPDGAVLAEAALRLDKGHDATLEATATAPGEHVLALLSYGGSDGSSAGDHVAWRIEAR